MTVMFTDLVDSTARSTRVGATQADALRGTHFALLRDILTRHRGEEVKTLGDGIMGVFTSATASVNAAVAIQQTLEVANRSHPDSPQLRVGLSLGEVTEEAGDYFGEAVIEAARLCAEAAPGQILCSRVVRQLAESRCRHQFRTVGPRVLKGMPGTCEVEEVAWPALVDRGLAGDFAHVDEGNADAALSCLETQRGNPFLDEVRRELVELLHPQPGQRLLDLGSGTGEDAIGLARLVGDEGCVVGIDKSTTLVAEAQRRAAIASVSNVEFKVGDAERLPLDNDTFDACRSDRVFQYLADPLRAVHELARVTRPGGRIAVADTDWGACIFDADDLELERRIQQAWCDTRPSGLVGRQLYGLFIRAGLTDVAVRARTTVLTRADELLSEIMIPSYASQAIDAGVVTSEEASRWVAFQKSAGAASRFFRFFVMFVVDGRVPG